MEKRITVTDQAAAVERFVNKVLALREVEAGEVRARWYGRVAACYESDCGISQHDLELLWSEPDQAHPEFALRCRLTRRYPMLTALFDAWYFDGDCTP